MFKVKVRLSRGEIQPPYVGTARAVPHLCVLHPGICLKTEGKSKGVGGAGTCQGSRKVPGTIQCVDRAALYRQPGQAVDPDLSVLGEPAQRSVSVDIYRAALRGGSPHQLTLSRISQRSDVVGKERGSQIIVYLLMTPWTHSRRNQTVVLVPGDPIRCYLGHLNYLCHLYNVSASMRPNCVQCRPLPSGGGQQAITVENGREYIRNKDTHLVFLCGFSTQQPVIKSSYRCMYG